MKEASYYIKQNGKVQCLLCPHKCIISEGKRGSCRVRKNENGQLISENYGQVCSLHFDPIEKKPLYHFFPGKTIFSVGSVGCNLHCKFCQNWEISQTGVEEYPNLNYYTPEEIVNMAKERKDNFGIAYTYNEPAVWYEFMLDIAKPAKLQGLKNVIVTNGYINPEPLEELIPYMDAFSIDLKALSEDFYRKFTSSGLEPVLNTLKTIKKYGKHFEITNLVITDTNDNVKEFSRMVDWLTNELGKDTVLHISRYFPTYKMNKEATSVSKLRQLFEIASNKLNYVYIGNIRTGEGQNTFCHECNHLVINRVGYFTEASGLDNTGKCIHCGKQILSES
ncbi:MAG: AmmeMemoRadiSam system radical SAM enzyme [Bacteroidetes bacterium]|nr:AmmeMemoRadiSam system radical SAM enzyme [Bacteroidota bacterium]MBL7104224.1 AmmeMemoRadiSam system radical SAM enzyme [Bacteroidales bacterium]